MKISWIWVVVGAIAAYWLFKVRYARDIEELRAARKKQESLAKLEQMLKMPGSDQAIQNILAEIVKNREQTVLD